MTIKAYILVNARAGTWEGVVKRAQTLPGIESCESITGPFDIIIAAEVAQIDDLRVLLRELQVVEGVERTTTCVVV